MRIATVSTTRKKYGGGAYEEAVREALSEEFNVKRFNAGVVGRGRLRYLEAPLILWRLFEISRKEDLDVVIRNFEASLFLSDKPVKNVLLLYHVDSSCTSLLLKPLYSVVEKIVLRNRRKFDAIVVISEYWRGFLERLGCENVRVIYSAFDPGEFHFTKEEVEDFKRKYGLVGKPIIYLGNAQRKKGVEESFNELNGLDAHLITSGRSQVEIPALNLDLERRDYLKLLKASSVVVTMSKFKEGWCMTAHEAMLCKTPVVGSGCGGMRELLEGGGQLICENFGELRSKVVFALDHPELGERGYEFGKKFTMDRFRREWVELARSLKA